MPGGCCLLRMDLCLPGLYCQQVPKLTRGPPPQELLFHLPHLGGLPNVARTSQSLPGLDVEKTRTVRLKPQKSWEPSGEKQSEWAAVNSS